MRHPEKGEVRSATLAMDQRMRAVSAMEGRETFNIASANVDRRTGDMECDDPLAIGGVYGDLFDVGEMVSVGVGVCEAFLLDIASGRRDPVSAMVSLYLQAAGVGALMERRRWER